ncbi:MAG: hypothetical protein AB1750_12135 [Chloroflexota bacterium]
MNRRLLLVILIAGALAYFTRDAIERAVIRPLLYALWIAKLYYDSMPQAFLWILLVGAVVLMAVASFAAEGAVQSRQRSARKPAVGEVELLAEWMARAPRGHYFKWLIAQRLGRLARGLVSFNARQARPSAWEPIAGPDWNPPGEVASYLEAGINGSFADYPRPRWPFRRPNPTPLDLDPNAAIDYIEARMKKS